MCVYLNNIRTISVLRVDFFHIKFCSLLVKRNEVINEVVQVESF